MPSCELINFPSGGSAIICGPRRSKPKKCFYCTRPSGWLCDLPIGLPVGLDPSEQRVCDRSICVDHRVVQYVGALGETVDWCAQHSMADLPF